MKKAFLLLFFLLFKCLVFANLTHPATVDSLLQLAVHNKNNDSLSAWLIHRKKASQYYRDQRDSEQSLKLLDETLLQLWREPHSKIEKTQLAWIYTNRAYLFEQHFADFIKARSDYEQSFRWFESIGKEDFYVARFVWHPLGNIYTRLGENERAIHFIRKSLELYRKLKIGRSQADAYNDLGLIYINTGAFKKAITALKRGISIDDAANKGLLYSNLAKAYEASAEIEAGLSAIQMAINFLLQENGKGPANSYLINAFSLYGNLLIKHGDHQLANRQFERALVLKDALLSPKHRKVANVYLGFGLNALKQKDAIAALQAYQNALIHSIHDFNDSSILALPDQSLLHAEVTLGQALIGKANAARLRYEASHKMKWLIMAKDCYQLYFEWEKHLRREYYFESSKLLFTAELHRTTEAALSLLYDLQALDKTGNWGELAFQWMEQSKGILLSESTIQLNHVLPEFKTDSSFRQYRWSKRQLRLLKAGLGGIQDSLERRKELQKLAGEIQLLEQDLALRFPKLALYKSKGNTAISTADVKAFSDREEVNFISYFLGDSTGFVSLVHNHRISFIKIERKLCRQHFEQLQKLLYNFGSEANAYEIAARKLYQCLISPIDSIAKHPKWIILADGELYGLPFEALVKETKATNDFKSLDYLLHHRQISYVPSLKFLLLPVANKGKQRNYLGIKPDFSKTTFSYLPYAQKEITIGKSVFDGELLVDSNATKTAILNALPDYKIIHWVSHAQQAKDSWERSWVAVSPTEAQAYQLYPAELFPLELNTQLLVLNACETGKGLYFEGEGSYSLARSFIIAGTQNIITNLWEANHDVNAKIFASFYKHVGQAQSLSYSLSQAKRDFLAHPATDQWGAHPYYWSSLILSGNNRPIDIAESNGVLLLLSLGTMAILLVVYLIRRSSSKASGSSHKKRG